MSAISALEELYGLQGASLDQEQQCLERLLEAVGEGTIQAVADPAEQQWFEFVSYVFNRRFGWSENSAASATKEEQMLEMDSRAKKRINDTLDQVLVMLKRAPLQAKVLAAFARWAPSSHKPVVRQRSFFFVYEWVKRQGNQDQDFQSQAATTMETLVKVIILSLSDVWSATRKAAAEKLEGVAKLLLLDQVHVVLEQILDTYAETSAGDDNKDDWKVKEGCLLGLTGLLRVLNGTEEEGGEGLGPARRERLKPLLFKALAHQQLSVRETAAKAFAAFLAKSALAEQEACLTEVVFKLAMEGGDSEDEDEDEDEWGERGGGGEGSPISSRGGWSPSRRAASALQKLGVHSPSPIRTPLSAIGKKKLVQKTISSPDLEHADQGVETSPAKKWTAWQSLGHLNTREEKGEELPLVEAFEAQGLLSLCGDLLERLPSPSILAKWDTLVQIFNLYLAHSASTVRQTCSALYLQILAKDDAGSSQLQHLVLHSLSSTITDSELACCSTQLTPHTGGGGHQRYYGGVSPLPSSEHPSSRRTDDEDGVSRMGSEEVNGDRRESGERDRESNISTEFLCVSGEFPRAEEHREQSAGGFQNSWEWREGRLLVYELVLGHLVKDHTTKMFKCDASKLSVSPKKISPKDGYLGAHFNSKPSDTRSSPLHQSPYNPAPLLSPSPPSSNTSASPQAARRSPSALSPSLSPSASPRLRSRISPPAQLSVRGEMSLIETLRAEEDSAAESGAWRVSPGGGGGGGGGGLGEDLADVAVAAGANAMIEPLSQVLERMLQDVLGCVRHVRWELRRMALQVLPLLCVTALWYDKGILSRLWLRYLPHDVTPGASRLDPAFTYVAALTLKEVVKKSLEYAELMGSGLAQALPLESRNRTAGIVHWVEHTLPSLLPLVENLLASSLRLPLRVGSLAVQLLILVHCRFPAIASPRQREQVLLITRWLAHLQALAHTTPDDQNSASKDPSTPAKRTPRCDAIPLSPYPSALSPTPELHDAQHTPSPAGGVGSKSREWQSKRAAENLERALLKQICPLLPDLIASCSFDQMLLFTPILLQYLEHYREDSDTDLELLEALHRVLHLPLSCWNTSAAGTAPSGGGVRSEGAPEPSLAHKPHAVMEAVVEEGTSAPSETPPAQGSSDPLFSDEADSGLRIDAARTYPCGFGTAGSKRQQQRYSYHRPWVPAGAWRVLSAPSSAMDVGARWFGDRTASGSGALSVEALSVAGMCDMVVGSLLVLVEIQSSEPALLRAVLSVLLSACRVVGDGRFVARICAALSARLKTPAQSDVGQSEAAHVRALQIMSNDIAEEASSPTAASEAALPPGLSGSSPFKMGNNAFFSQTFSLRPKGRAGQLPSLSVQLEAQSPGKVKEDKDEGDGEEAEEEEEEDSGSDWDDWSDEEDVSAVETEAANFLDALKRTSREWAAPAAHHALLRKLEPDMDRDHAGAPLRTWDAVLGRMLPQVRNMVQRLT